MKYITMLEVWLPTDSEVMEKKSNFITQKDTAWRPSISRRPAGKIKRNMYHKEQCQPQRKSSSRSLRKLKRLASNHHTTTSNNHRNRLLECGSQLLARTVGRNYVTRGHGLKYLDWKPIPHWERWKMTRLDKRTGKMVFWWWEEGK